MPVSTEKLLREGMLPAREWTGERVDFVRYARDFDPALLPGKSVETLGKRYPAILVENTVEHEAQFAEHCAQYQLDELKKAQDVLDGILKEAGENPDGETLTLIRRRYKDCRSHLIAYMGQYCAAYLLRQRSDAMSEEEREQDRQRVQREKEERESRQDEWPGGWYPVYEATPLADKLLAVRKALSKQQGKRIITQRNYAKLIGYPISKYVDWEKGTAEREERETDFRLLFILVSRLHVNPIWLVEGAYEEEAGVDIEWEGNTVDEYAQEDFWDEHPIFWKTVAILDWLCSEAKQYGMDKYI